MLCCLLFFSACSNQDTNYPKLTVNETKILDIQSNDSILANLFKWAVGNSNKYGGSGE